MNTTLELKPIHPFPARMAPSIIFNRLPANGPELCVLDPMAGSGTTLVAARLRGHRAIGFDTDPLAILIARAWSSDVDADHLRAKAGEILERAKQRYITLSAASAYPRHADEETKAFVRFWFDLTNRRQLAALSDCISHLHDAGLKALLWCAMSRLIITKSCGVSRAMDVSHSRPHRVCDIAPVTPFERFVKSVEDIIKGSPFTDRGTLPKAQVRQGDARRLPLKDSSVDVVITSPPYLNAIDYLRGHKLSLVWMGHSIEELRSIRSANVGTECLRGKAGEAEVLAEALKEMGEIDDLPDRTKRMLGLYVSDMNRVMAEISRVLVKDGRAILVVGNSTIRDVFIKNSSAIAYLGKLNGLDLTSVRSRPLPENRRYLPPPGSRLAGKQLRSRMSEEVIISLVKAAAATSQATVVRLEQPAVLTASAAD
jgi:SAM-dependent methyltransferase